MVSNPAKQLFEKLKKTPKNSFEDSEGKLNLSCIVNKITGFEENKVDGFINLEGNRGRSVFLYSSDKKEYLSFQLVNNRSNCGVIEIHKVRISDVRYKEELYTRLKDLLHIRYNSDKLDSETKTTIYTQTGVPNFFKTNMIMFNDRVGGGTYKFCKWAGIPTVGQEVYNGNSHNWIQMFQFCRPEGMYGQTFEPPREPR